MIIPEMLFKKEQAPIIKQIKKYTTLKHQNKKLEKVFN